MWLRAQIPQTEEGQQQWTQTVEWLNTPPPSVQRVLAVAPVRRSLPSGAPEGTPVGPEAEAQAFASFLGSSPKQG